VDSISAVEAAWTKKAKELDIDAQKLIKDSHGRRVADMLKEVDPDLNDDNSEEKAQREPSLN
jgi:beta-phosphoglucomutase-like phosphatase (HAD superfamily)